MMNARATVALMLLAGTAFGQMPGRQAEYVQVEKATTGKDRIIRRSIGHVEAIQTVHVRTAVEGFLLEPRFREGSLVQEGDVLFEIEPTRYRAIVQQAEAELEQIDAQIVYARNNYERLSRLAATAATSREDTESAHTRLEELRASRAGAEAELVKARKDLEDCTIRAEITGFIGRMDFAPRNYVTRGEQLATITQMSPIYLRFPLSQSDVNGIFRGPKEIANVADVRLTTASGRRYPHQGRVAIVDNLLAGDTDTYTLWAEFDNSEHILTPRGIGALAISLTATSEVTMVPLTAVQHDATGSFVYTVSDEGVVARREVISGSIQGRLQSIYDGLQPGETVITEGAHKTRVGARVIPVYPDESRRSEATPEVPCAEEVPVSVQLATVSPVADPTVILCQGARVEAINRVDMRPLVQGILEEQAFREGDLVRKGDVLFRIDSTRYQAAVDSQKSKIAQLEVRLADAQTKHARQQQLLARNATSRDELESAKATVDDLKAQLSSAQAALTIAEDDLSRCTIRAAMDGRIGRVHFSRGNYISDMKSPLASLVQLSPIYVRFSLSEHTILSHFGNDENMIRHFGNDENMIRDTDITLITANGTTYPEKGRISFCDNVIQSATDTQNIWAVFDNADLELSPGGVVTIRVTRKQDIQLPSVPAEAILTDTLGHYVFVMKNGRAILTRVLTGATTEDGRTVIFSGLQNGEQVIISNLAELEDEEPVRPEGDASVQTEGEAPARSESSEETVRPE